MFFDSHDYWPPDDERHDEPPATPAPAANPWRRLTWSETRAELAEVGERLEQLWARLPCCNGDGCGLCEGVQELTQRVGELESKAGAAWGGDPEGVL